MVRSLYVSILLALALVAGHSEAAAPGTNAMARRQPFGVAQGFGQSSTYVHSESHSFDSVMTTYNDLLGRIRSCQSEFQHSSFTSEIATQHIQQLATQFQTALSQFQGCVPCMSANQIVNFRRTFSELFTSFQSLVQISEQRFQDRSYSLFGSSFTALQEEFTNFFNVCQNGGLPVNTFFPQQLGSFFNKFQMSSTSSYLRKVGYSF